MTQPLCPPGGLEQTPRRIYVVDSEATYSRAQTRVIGEGEHQAVAAAIPPHAHQHFHPLGIRADPAGSFT